MRINSKTDRDKKKKDATKKRFLRKKICRLCVDKVYFVDYKESERLSKYISEKGRIVPRRISGLCASCQRHVAQAIRRARVMALLPFVND